MLFTNILKTGYIQVLFLPLIHIFPISGDLLPLPYHLVVVFYTLGCNGVHSAPLYIIYTRGLFMLQHFVWVREKMFFRIRTLIYQKLLLNKRYICAHKTSKQINKPPIFKFVEFYLRQNKHQIHRPPLEQNKLKSFSTGIIKLLKQIRKGIRK